MAVSFRSPYGVRDLAHLGHQAALMLQSGAFTHLFVNPCSPLYIHTPYPFCFTELIQCTRFGPDCLYTVEDLWDAVFVVQAMTTSFS